MLNKSSLVVRLFKVKVVVWLFIPSIITLTLFCFFMVFIPVCRYPDLWIRKFTLHGVRRELGSGYFKFNFILIKSLHFKFNNN